MPVYAIIVTGFALNALALPALAGPKQPVWVASADPQVDLWYFALATVGAPDPGPLRVHNDAFVEAARRQKLERRIFPTPLDRESARLRVAIQADTAFAILEFMPLLFMTLDRRDLLCTLNDIADGNELSTFEPRAQFGASILLRVLRRRSHQDLLRDLVRLVQLEWELFFRDYWKESRIQEDRVGAVQAALDTVWDSGLRDVFQRYDLAAGKLFWRRRRTLATHGAIPLRDVSFGGDSIRVTLPDALGAPQCLVRWEEAGWFAGPCRSPGGEEGTLSLQPPGYDAPLPNGLVARVLATAAIEWETRTSTHFKIHISQSALSFDSARSAAAQLEAIRRPRPSCLSGTRVRLGLSRRDLRTLLEHSSEVRAFLR